MENKQVSHSEALPGKSVMEKLAASHVAVFGLGSVGSWCAEALVRAGVGTLTLVDDDMVSPADLNRQVQATQSSIGQPKAIAMSVRLREINPNGRFIPKCYRYSAAGQEDFFPADYDYIVDAIGQDACKLDLIETAVSYGIPIVSALGVGSNLDAVQVQIADISKTAGCPLREQLRNRGIERLKVVFSPDPAAAEVPPADRRPAPAGIPWGSPVAGFLLAQTVVLDLTQN